MTYRPQFGQSFSAVWRFSNDLSAQLCPPWGTTTGSGYFQQRAVSSWFHSIFRPRIARHRPAKSGEAHVQRPQMLPFLLPSDHRA